MTEVDKLHGLHNTGMTMHERFTILARQTVGRRGRANFLRGRSPRARGKGRTNPALIEAIIHQLNNSQNPITEIPFHGRGRGRGGLRRYGSEGSLRSVALRRKRSNSFGYADQANKDQRWRHSNGNLSSNAGSVNGSVYSARGVQPRGYWLRGDAVPRRRWGGARARGGARGRGGGRIFRGRVHQGRVHRPTEPAPGVGRPVRGSGRRGVRRNTEQAARGQARGRGGLVRGRGRGRGRGGPLRAQPPKPVPTREELDAQLERYMSGTKAALDKELDEYMSHVMDFD